MLSYDRHNNEINEKIDFNEPMCFAAQLVLPPKPIQCRQRAKEVSNRIPFSTIALKVSGAPINSLFNFILITHREKNQQIVFVFLDFHQTKKFKLKLAQEKIILDELRTSNLLNHRQSRQFSCKIKSHSM